MIPKCPGCGKDLTKFPLKGQPEKTFKENFKEKTVIWKNLFRIDLMSALFMIIIVCMVVAYNTDIAKCDSVMEDPCDFCDNSGCCNRIMPLTEQEVNFHLPDFSNLTVGSGGGYDTE